jgi:hypothetical protein
MSGYRNWMRHCRQIWRSDLTNTFTGMRGGKVMEKKRGILQAFTADRHFAQAGFEALLLWKRRVNLR